MNNICKQLMQHSIIQRNWTILAICSSKQSYVDFSQDTHVHKTECFDKKYAVTLHSPNFDNVQRNVITNIQHNSNDMDVKGAIEMINNLHTKFKANEEIHLEELKNSYAFVHMCKVIYKNARCLPINDIIHILRTLLFCKVSVNSRLIQTLLQLTSVSVNNLSLKQIIAIYYTLCRVEKLPLVQALLIALPHVFKEQARLELSTESNNLMQTLKFCTAIDDMETGKHIINLLVKKKEIMDVNHIVDITHALHSLPRFCASSRKLLYRVQNKILTNADSLHYKQIEKLLYYISKNAMKQEAKFYKEDVINALCHAVVRKDCTFQEKICILKQLNRMHYSNTIILDTIAHQCLKNSDTLRSCTSSDITIFIEGFVIANYKPCYWKALEAVLKNYVTNTDYTLHHSTSVSFFLLSLNCYFHELLERTFTLFNRVPVSPKMTETLSIALKLHWCVKLLYPIYNGIMIEEDKLQHIMIEPECNCTLSIMESLVAAVGSNEYVKCGLQTKFGQYVDYVVVLQPNGTPMNVSHYNNFKFVEELASLSNCIKILFFAIQKCKYSINKRNIASTVKMQLKAIETLPGFYSFIINPYNWEVFSRENKIQHLQEAIKSRQLN